MALLEVELDARWPPLPRDVSALVVEAERRIDAFVEERSDDPIVGFVPSDFHAAYGALAEIARRRLAPGDLFCEWGSGFGVVAMLAARLDYTACAIEIEPDLVDRSIELAEDFDVPVEVACGSFIPEGGDEIADGTYEFAWLRTDAPSGYAELELDPRDFDVIFAYPWPGEEEVVLELFDRYAAPGALLVTYQGIDEIRVRRRSAARTRPRGRGRREAG